MRKSLIIFSVIAPLALAQSPTPVVVTTAEKRALINPLPPPQITVLHPKLLTLEDAIGLALRNNPTVLNSRLQRLNDKFALELANYAYEPHFALSGNVTFTENQKTGYNINPGVTWDSRWGTHIQVSNTTNLNGTQQEEAKITQHLMRGFGAVNNFPWLNAQDSEQAARQTFKTSIITMVSQVIQNYRQLVEDYNNLGVQNTALKRQEETAKQYQLRVKAGKMAPSELLQQQATLANTRLQTVQQQNAAEQDYQTLLDTIGLSPTSKVHIVTKIDFHAYHPPTKEQAINIALHNNPAFVSEQLQLNASQRAVASAKDNLRWQLDLTGQANFLSSSGNIPIVEGFENLTTTTNPSATLSLTIPIRDITSRGALVQAQVAYAQAIDNLEQSRRSLIREVVNSLTNLNSQLNQLNIAEQALVLQRKNLEAEQIKQRYGQTTALNVNIIQDNLIQQEINFVNSQIAYLNSVNTFQNLLGITLDVWNIQLRF